MSRSILSAIGVVAAGSLVLLFKNYFADQQELIQKDLLKRIIITLRKRFFSTLREIAFIVNNIRTQQAHFQSKKISQIMMKDGGTGDAKLNIIQNLTLQAFNTSRKVFQDSCNYYNHNDLQIKLLLQTLKMDIQLSLQGTITAYKGPTPNFSSQKVIFIYRELLKRRMHIIQQKLTAEITTNQCLDLQFQVEQYLQMEGVKHQKQPNQKVFISILQKKYREDSDFRIQFQNLQLQMEQFTVQIQKKQILQLSAKIQNQDKKQ